MLMKYCVVVKAKWLPACHGQRPPACHFGLLNACFKLMLVLRFGLGWNSCLLAHSYNDFRLAFGSGAGDNWHGLLAVPVSLSKAS